MPVEALLAGHPWGIKCGKGKAKFTLEQTLKAQRGSRGIAPLLF
jgi:hypothetical protein